jgi:uncharacterized membrane protein
MIYLVILVVALIALRARALAAKLEITVNELAARLDAVERRHSRVDRALGPDPILKAAPATPAAAVRPPTAPEGPRPIRLPSAEPAPGVSTPPPARPGPTAPPTPAPERAAVPSVAAVSAESLESRIGSRWLLYIGVIAIVVGVSYFEKLAIDNHWIGETARVLQGGFVGLLLVYAGLRFVGAGYAVYGQMISGCGVAVLYVSTYAAFNFYHLIDRPAAFILMCGVTTLAAWLADRQRSQGLALMAVGGGFATPFLIPSDMDAQLALFGYESILIGGTMFLAHRREWPALNVVSYLFTVLTVGGWAERFYTPAKYLPTELFLTLFCAMYLYILRESRRRPGPVAELAQAVLWTAPIGYYTVSLAVLGPHPAPLLVYLLALALTGAIAGTRVDVGAASSVRLVLWLAVALPLLSWADVHAGRTWLVPGLAASAGVYVIFLLAHLEWIFRNDRPLDRADIAAPHLNALATYASAYLLIAAVNSSATGLVAALFALWHALLAFAVATRRREQALHFAAVAFTLLAIAITLEYDGAAVIVGWAAEGAVIIWLGLRERREWLRVSGIVVFAIAVAQLLALQMTPPGVNHVLLLNSKAGCGAFVIALAYGLAWLHDRARDLPARRTQVGVALTAATLLILAAAVAEITDYWMLHAPRPFEPASQIIAASLLVCAAIVWLGLVRRQEWMRAIGALGVFVSAFSLLAIQFSTAPAGYAVVLNARAAAGVLAIAVLYGLAAIHRRLGEHVEDLPLNIAVLLTGASLFTLSLLTSEIDAYWAARGAGEMWSMTRECLKTIAWGAVGATLVWLGVVRREAWTRVIGSAVLLIAVLRLLGLELAGPSATYVVVANARILTALILVALLCGLVRIYRRQDETLDSAWHPVTVLLIVANVLGLALLTSEITAYWTMQDLNHFTAFTPSRDSHLAREMMVSITWALYATALVVAGIRKQYAPIRYFAIAVFAVTIVKVFAIDLAELDQVYRVLSIVGLGATLLMTSYLYNRFRTRLER